MAVSRAASGRSWADMASDSDDDMLAPLASTPTTAAPAAHTAAGKLKAGELDLELDNSRDGINLFFRTSLKVGADDSAKPAAAVPSLAASLRQVRAAAAPTTAATAPSTATAPATASTADAEDAELVFGTVTPAQLFAAASAAMEGCAHETGSLAASVAVSKKRHSSALAVKSASGVRGDGDSDSDGQGPSSSANGAGAGAGSGAATSASPTAKGSPTTTRVGKKRRLVGPSPTGAPTLQRSTSACEALTSSRLEKRQRQIDIGKATPGYQNYCRAVPKSARRTRVHPVTPSKHKTCSKRSWDGQVRMWRRALHNWDDWTPEQGDSTTNTATASPAAASTVPHPPLMRSATAGAPRSTASPAPVAADTFPPLAVTATTTTAAGAASPATRASAQPQQQQQQVQTPTTDAATPSPWAATGTSAAARLRTRATRPAVRRPKASRRAAAAQPASPAAPATTSPRTPNAATESPLPVSWASLVSAGAPATATAITVPSPTPRAAAASPGGMTSPAAPEALASPGRTSSSDTGAQGVWGRKVRRGALAQSTAAVPADASVVA